MEEKKTSRVTDIAEMFVSMQLQSIAQEKGGVTTVDDLFKHLCVSHAAGYLKALMDIRRWMSLAQSSSPEIKALDRYCYELDDTGAFKSLPGSEFIKYEEDRGLC
jgi:hypothetical protein